MSVVYELQMPESEFEIGSTVFSSSFVFLHQVTTIKKMTITRKKETTPRMMMTVMMNLSPSFSTTVVFMLAWPGLRHQGTSQ